MVGQRVLVPLIEVRVFEREPARKGRYCSNNRWVNDLLSAIEYGHIFESMPVYMLA